MKSPDRPPIETCGAIVGGVIVGLAVLIFFLLLDGCQTTARFNETAYGLQTSCLADMRTLMDKAITPYTQNLDEIKIVNAEIERAYQYDRGRTLNQPTIQMWELMRDPTQPMFAGLLKRWQDKGQLSPVYVQEKKKLVQDAFDQITQFEVTKIK